MVPRAGRAVQAAALMPGRSPLRSWVPPTPDPSTGDELVGLLLAAHGAPAGRLGHLHAVPRSYQHGARSPFISGRPARGRASIRIISSISGAMATRIARYPRPRQLRPSSEHCSPSATPNPLPGYARRMPRWLNGNRQIGLGFHSHVGNPAGSTALGGPVSCQNHPIPCPCLMLARKERTPRNAAARKRLRKNRHILIFQVRVV